MVPDEPNRANVKSEPFASGFEFGNKGQVESADGVIDLVGDNLPSFDGHHSDADVEHEEQSQSSSGETSSSSSSSSACEEPLQQKYGLSGETRDCAEPVYQHKKSRVLHRPNKVSGLLACGRRIGGGYNFLEHGASFKWARCSLCFKGEVISKVEDLADALATVHARRKLSR